MCLEAKERDLKKYTYTVHTARERYTAAGGPSNGPPNHAAGSESEAELQQGCRAALETQTGYEMKSILDK